MGKPAENIAMLVIIPGFTSNMFETFTAMFI
jgi:hypothetical protein